MKTKKLYLVRTGTLHPQCQTLKVTTEGVLKLLRKLNPNQASGPDLLQARSFKELSEEIAPILCNIYQKCLTAESPPPPPHHHHHHEVWKTASVSTIFKKGERSEANNYRPVSLTCISCKMFEHIIVGNMMRHLDKYDILTDCQHVFRHRRSCETQHDETS